MRRSFNPGKEPSFQKIVISSVVLHLIFIAVTVIPLVHKKKEIKNYYVSLVNPAVIRKAEVSNLPLKTTVAEKKVVEKTKKIEPVKNLKEEKKVKMSMDSTKVSERVDIIKEKLREREEKAQKLANIISNLKANAKKTAEVASSKSSNLYAGMKSDDARLLYESDVKGYIQGFWNIPKSINVEGLEATIEIKIDKYWKIISYKIIEPSGNRIFDRSVIKALLDAQASTELKPLPEPPLEFLEEAIKEGIEFKFYDENSR